MGSARVRGRQGQEGRGEHIMAAILGSCHTFSDDWAGLTTSLELSVQFSFVMEKIPVTRR